MKKVLILGFVSGVIGVVLFHQGTQLLLHYHAAKVPGLIELFGRAAAPYNMAPVPPLGVPTVVSQAFWGGLWGIVIAACLRNNDWPDLLFGFAFGAVVVTLVAFTVVATLKGLPMMAGGNRQTWARAALLNGTFGWGTAFILRPLALRGRS